MTTLEHDSFGEVSNLTAAEYRMLATSVASELVGDVEQCYSAARRRVLIALVALVLVVANLATRASFGILLAGVFTSIALGAGLRALDVVREGRVGRRWIREELDRATLVDLCSPYDSVSVEDLANRVLHLSGNRDLSPSRIQSIAQSMVTDRVLRPDRLGNVRLAPDAASSYSPPWTRYEGIARRLPPGWGHLSPAKSSNADIAP